MKFLKEQTLLDMSNLKIFRTLSGILNKLNPVLKSWGLELIFEMFVKTSFYFL